MALSNFDRFTTSSGVEQANLSITAGSGEENTGGIKVERLDGIRVAHESGTGSIVNVGKIP